MIGELGNSLNKRLAKHKRVTKNNDDKDRIDEPHLETKHRINRLDQRERLKSSLQNWLSTECVTNSSASPPD